jgi:hypothetical protein
MRGEFSFIQSSGTGDFSMKVAKHVGGQFVYLMVGDELIVPGFPQHKMRYVGPIGPRGEDVVDPAKGQAARLVHFDYFPNRDQLLVGERGTSDWNERLQIQERAHDVIERGVVNLTLRQNCEHIGSYIRHGKPESPQLRFWVGTAAAVAMGFAIFGSGK